MGGKEGELRLSQPIVGGCGLEAGLEWRGDDWPTPLRCVGRASCGARPVRCQIGSSDSSGAISTIATPAIIIVRLDTTPSSLPISRAFAVPTP